MPSRSFTACRNRCLHPRYFSVVCTETWPSKNWICSGSPPESWRRAILQSLPYPHSKDQSTRMHCPESYSTALRVRREQLCTFPKLYADNIRSPTINSGARAILWPKVSIPNPNRIERNKDINTAPARPNELKKVRTNTLSEATTESLLAVCSRLWKVQSTRVRYELPQQNPTNNADSYAP